jgi:hypothetical protein
MSLTAVRILRRDNTRERREVLYITFD